MPELLSPGMPWTLVQNRVYALPAVKVTLTTDATSPTLQQSDTQEFTANVAVTLTGGAATLAGGFIRCTSGACLVVLKRD